MTSFVTLFSLLFFLSLNSYADPVQDQFIPGRYFKRVSEDKAHLKIGRAHSDELDSKNIKVLVWNIKKSLLNTWREEFDRFKEGKDLILLQEAFQKEIFTDSLNSSTGYRWDMGISFFYRAYNDAATGTMIGSHVNPTDVKVVHTIDLEPVTNTPKSMTFAKYPLKDSKEDLLVVSVHGINLTNYGSFERHMLQAKKVISNHPGPVIFAGDFNTRTKSRMSYLMGLVKELNLKTVTFRNGNQRMRWKFTMNYLDHGFVRGLSVIDANVDGDSVGSDHKPLFLELSLDPKKM